VPPIPLAVLRVQLLSRGDVPQRLHRRRSRGRVFYEFDVSISAAAVVAAADVVVYVPRKVSQVPRRVYVDVKVHRHRVVFVFQPPIVTVKRREREELFAGRRMENDEIGEEGEEAPREGRRSIRSVDGASPGFHERVHVAAVRAVL